MKRSVISVFFIVVVLLINTVQSSIVLSDSDLYEQYLSIEYGDRIVNKNQNINSLQNENKLVENVAANQQEEQIYNSLSLKDKNGGLLFDPSKFGYVTFYVKSPSANPELYLQFYNKEIPSEKLQLVSEKFPNHAASHLSALTAGEWQQVKIPIPEDSHYDRLSLISEDAEEPIQINRILFQEKQADYTFQSSLYRIKASYADPSLGGANGGSMFWTADTNQWIFGSYHSWYSAGDSGRLQVLPNGDVVIHSGLVPTSEPWSCHTWYVHLLFKPTQAPSHPHKELSPSAYVPNGPIDPSTWSYYLPVPGYSYMIATGCNHVSKITFTGVPEGMPMQLGIGANGKNGVLGASVWMTYMDEFGISHGNSIIDMNIDILNI